MHPRSIEIAAINNIEMIIKHTMHESEGTRLNNNEIKMEIRNAVTGIPTSKGVSKVTINNIDDKNKQSVEPRRVITKKIGRNEPCPCGSGKKYKQCHGI